MTDTGFNAEVWMRPAIPLFTACRAMPGQMELVLSAEYPRAKSSNVAGITAVTSFNAWHSPKSRDARTKACLSPYRE